MLKILGFSLGLGSSETSQQEVDCDSDLSHGGSILVTPIVIGPLQEEEILKRQRRVNWQKDAGRQEFWGQGGQEEEAPEGRVGKPFEEPLELCMWGSQTALTNP